LLQQTLSAPSHTDDMAFDWKEYLKLAQSLQGHSGSSFSQEAAFRCAVSRAYYAAFCYARKYAQDNESYVRPTKNEHKALREHFEKSLPSGSSQVDGRDKIATNLQKLKLLRNKCDYEDIVANIEDKLLTSLDLAEEIITTLT